jgi:Zn-dependent protease with chaperone function
MAKKAISATEAQLQRSRKWRRAALALLSLPAIAIAASSALAKARAQGRNELAAPGDGTSSSANLGQGRDDAMRQLQRLVDGIRTRLGIERGVTVELVDKNPYLISVEAPANQADAFVVRVEAQMLQLLSMEEIEAALAHELGHVWIFTHHPYLQTELLANQVAMRAVSRDALARVYQKVWQSGPKGDLVAFLGNGQQ